MSSVLVREAEVTAYGTDGNDLFKAVQVDQWIILGTHMLVGGLGDDAYYVTNATTVVEAINGGVDTIVSSTNYKLPDNVESLHLWGTAAGIGNDGSNTIFGGGGATFINGGKGDDHLLGGGAGVDAFQFDAKSGHDTIFDWDAADKIRLAGYTQFSDFTQVKSALTQAGKDVVFKLDAENDITLLNTKLTDLTASNFQYTLNLSKHDLTLSFADEFDSFSARATRTSPGTWSTEQGDSRGSDALESRTLMTNGERQIYVDPGFKGRGPTELGLNPFSVKDGVLTITGQAAPEAIQDALYGYDYTSGYMSTRDTFAQTYGYFEARLQLPAAMGSWPAFWLFRKDGMWPPEMDILEAWNDTTAVQTLHTAETTVHRMTSSSTWVPDGDTAFHNYGMLWTPETLTWYLDGVEVFSRPTPADMHSPMYMIVNLAISGAVDDPNFHEELKVDYVRSYAYTEVPQAIVDTYMGKVDGAPDGFNAAYYRSHNPDVVAAGIDAQYHYLHHGKFEGRLPYEGASALVMPTDFYLGKIEGMPDGFNPDFYAKQNPDVVAVGMDVLQHYLVQGKAEGRLPYDSADVLASGETVYLGARADKPGGFNLVYYALENPDVVAARIDLYNHYKVAGVAEGRLAYDPNAIPGDVPVTPPPVEPPVPVVPPVTPPPVTPTPEVTPPVDNPPLTSHGYWGRASTLHDGFNLDYYTAKNPDVVAAGINPLVHYLTMGKAEGRLPFDPTDTTPHADWGMVAGAPDGFNANYYALHNPDVVLAGMDPLQHYLVQGRAEGRAAYDAAAPGDVTVTPPPAVEPTVPVVPPVTPPPVQPTPEVTPPSENPPPAAHVYWGRASTLHDGFNLDYYTATNPDVVASGVNPLLHYLTAGKSEGRLPFDPTDTTPHADWGRVAGAPDGFNASYYATHNPDIVLAGMDPLQHYLVQGKSEGRAAYDLVAAPAEPTAPVDGAHGAAFDAAYYALHNPDVMLAGMDPLHHYRVAGRSEGRLAFDDGSGKDLIVGTSGNDMLVATATPFEVLTGGAGNDTFKFATGIGWDTIADFDVAHDKVDASALFEAYGAPTISDLSYTSGSIAHFGGGEAIVLLGVSAAEAQLVVFG